MESGIPLSSTSLSSAPSTFLGASSSARGSGLSSSAIGSSLPSIFPTQSQPNSHRARLPVSNNVDRITLAPPMSNSFHNFAFLNTLWKFENNALFPKHEERNDLHLPEIDVILRKKSFRILQLATLKYFEARLLWSFFYKFFDLSNDRLSRPSYHGSSRAGLLQLRLGLSMEEHRGHSRRRTQLVSGKSTKLC